ncbi:S1 RNA-binding domain-containing protein [Ruminococcus flavefaciens]|uniref:S1 RNA binding domain-containing protein n=1 Tax=Ruminococcus flavefaciens TaxID=1265 RepID=A0A1K1M2S6_RUMFL|nr:S1 RNA-binding domain-containing protein [Ruminococcus flavefaciens]SFW16230.1 S1 RNA binding domain-containing protein [Ruminococcus flavefaciens]
MEFRPEGCLYDSPSNQRYISTAEGLTEAMEKGIILEAKAILCTGSHDLIVELPCARGIIPREEGAIGIAEGKTRDIALISRVNKIVCFKVTELELTENGELEAKLSRKAAQKECERNFVSKLESGDIIDARISHMEKFGSFVDIGCGIPSLVPIDTMSVSRISHPTDRFRNGQLIKVVVKGVENGRIFLTHKELLGTWEENASRFRTGETVPGVVRSIESYGVFVELTPNLAGLAESKEGISVGQSVSVYIKAIIPEKMKVKLIIVDICGEYAPPKEIEYFINSNHIDHWKYSTETSDKNISTSF